MSKMVADAEQGTGVSTVRAALTLAQQGYEIEHFATLRHKGKRDDKEVTRFYSFIVARMPHTDRQVRLMRLIKVV